MSHSLGEVWKFVYQDHSDVVSSRWDVDVKKGLTAGRLGCELE